MADRFEMALRGSLLRGKHLFDDISRTVLIWHLRCNIFSSAKKNAVFGGRPQRIGLPCSIASSHYRVDGDSFSVHRSWP